MISYIASEQTITININGAPRLIKIKSKDHRNYIIRLLTECQKNESKENLEELWIALTPYKRVAHKVDGRIEYVEDLGKLFVKGIERPLPEVLQKRIMSFLDDELPIDALIKFWENCQLNPEFRAIEELYEFLEYHDIAITNDGCFVGYKKVYKIAGDCPEDLKGIYIDSKGFCRDSKNKFVPKETKQKYLNWMENGEPTFVDAHSRTIKQKIGDTITMPRQDCDNDRNALCSRGLHVGSWDYSSTFSGDTLLLVKVNPKDTVSIPADHSGQKLRSCAYTILCIAEENPVGIYIDND
jgi:hypothetical protein